MPELKEVSRLAAVGECVLSGGFRATVFTFPVGVVDVDGAVTKRDAVSVHLPSVLRPARVPAVVERETVYDNVFALALREVDGFDGAPVLDSEVRHPAVGRHTKPVVVGVTADDTPATNLRTVVVDPHPTASLTTSTHVVEKCIRVFDAGWGTSPTILVPHTVRL